MIKHSSSHTALSTVGPLTCSVTSSTAWGCLRNLGAPRKSRSWAVRPGSQGSERRVGWGRGQSWGLGRAQKWGHVSQVTGGTQGPWRWRALAGRGKASGRREEWRTEATGEQLGRGPPRTKILTWTRRQQGKGSRGVRLPEQALGQVWHPILRKCDHDNIAVSALPRQALSPALVFY